MNLVVAGAYTHVRIAAITPAALVTSYLSPLALAVVFIAKAAEPTPGIVIGAMLAAMWNTVLLQMFRLVRYERSWGTLQLIMASTSGIVRPLAGRLLGVLIQGLVAVPLVSALIWLGWRRLPLGPIGPAVLGFVVGLLGIAGAGMVLIWIFLVSRFASGAINGIFPITVLLMGLFAPLNRFPGVVRLVSYAFPPAWAVESVRLSSPGAAMIGLGVALVWIGGGCMLIRGVESKMRSSPAYYEA